MRRLLVAALLLALLAPSAPAQAAEPLLKDDAGDTTFTSGVPGAAPTPLNVAGQSESVDLKALVVEETDETLLLTLQVAKLDGNPGGEYAVEFTWRDTAYRALARIQSGQFGNFQNAYLQANLDEEGWEFVAPLLLTVDKAQGALTMELPKVFVLDGMKRAPGLGDTLGDLRVHASTGLFRFRLGSDDDYPVSFADSMPNDGAGVPLTFQMGDVSRGGLALVTDDRVRVSNGGATTFVYRAALRNNASRDEEVSLTLDQMPESWNGSVQSPVKVPAGGERTITVLLSVPFEHKHGGHDSFQVVAKGRDPNSYATLRLGVLHTPIPQPAGHHAELYLHALNQQGGTFGQVFGPLFPFNSGYVNTESTHDGEAEGVTMNAFRSDARAWRVPLNPVLRMGLDFDTEKTGNIAGAIKGGTNGEATLGAKLFLVSIGEDGEEQGLLLAQGQGAKVTLDMQKTTPFSIDLVPTPDADYIPYAKDQNLELQISMKSDAAFIGGFGPTQPLLLAKDFKMTLPLNEYHDRLTGVGEAEQGLALIADGAVQKTGRPGTVMTYAFDLKNGGGRDLTIDLDPAGNDARLGLLVPADEFSLPAGATKRVTLAVQIPGDATTGEELEVLVFAHAQEDPSLTALVRTLTTVSTGANATNDESGLLLAAQEAEEDTPGFGVALAIVALAGLALLVRRK